jgi:uncharacterized protein YdbL (DUF1318 family)
MRAILELILSGLLVTQLAGCVSAKIAVVDERTALENQILGSYEELDRDLQLLASVRSMDLAGETREAPSFVQVRALAVQARQTQQFNRDDIDEMKSAGCLGEANSGYLSLRHCQAASNPQVKKRLDRLVKSENDARKLVLSFVVTTSPDLTEKDLAQVTQAFARMQREKAKPGDWVQDDSGKWAQVQ